MVNFKSVTFSWAILATFWCFVNSNSEHCTPGVVSDITVDSEKQLTWSPASNPEKCTITGYVIDVFDSDDGSELQFQTSTNVLNYSLTTVLEMCKTYSVEVHAITDDRVLGPSDRVNISVAAPTDLKLDIKLNRPIVINKDQIDLTWNMVNTDISKCVTYYRVVYWDEISVPKDVYVSTNNYTLPITPVPCMKYTFQVTAIVGTPDNQGPTSEISWSGYVAVPEPPKLSNIFTDATTGNMTWKVPTYAENRCELTYLIVDTIGLRTTRVPIKDSALRPDVNVYLTGLEHDEIYISHVSLENSVGYSKNITITFQTSDSFTFNYNKDIVY